jgi:hypothetical protein
MSQRQEPDMTIEQKAAKLFGLTEERWERHANPWSVWTRASCLPFIEVAIWSRVWLGWWSLVPLALALLWTYFNPRLFPPPRTMQSWASRAVLGERVLAGRQTHPVPAHHVKASVILNCVASSGLPFVLYGLWALDLRLLIGGTAVLILGKFWYLDRMVWLYQDMKDAVPSYAAWTR